ncbi:Hypothetical protein A7982_11547 [Minicystis rosea]|nr:Hypothetical protein A7982_11547 [Minicystis rosea]
MNENASTFIPRTSCWRGAIGGLLLLMAAPACGGAVGSGVAVGKAGSGLSGHAHAAPQGAEVCALQEALSAPASGSEKQLSDSCSKALRSDQLWRRSMIVLAAHGATLEELASGGNTDNAGLMEAAGTGIRGSNWIEVESGPEQAARDAAAKLVVQMETRSSGGDLGKAVKDAGPHVKTLCDGLTAYFEAQGKSLADIQKDVEKKHASRADRRCGTLDSRSICVGESPVDRYVYANVFGQAALLESEHREAGEAIAGFCAAHRKLEEAANDGRLSSGKTYTDVVEAVKASKKAAPSGGGKSSAPAKK